MRKFIISFILCWIFTGFIMSCNHQQYHPSKGEQLVNALLAKTAKIIKNKYNLMPSGSGAAMPGGPIQELILCFDTKQPFTKEQLRDLLVKIANELMNQVNENKEIQKFLKSPPFSIRDVQIIIYNHDKEGGRLYDPQIGNAQIARAVLDYCTVDAKDSFKYKNRFVETYQEAVQALKDQKLLGEQEIRHKK